MLQRGEHVLLGASAAYRVATETVERIQPIAAAGSVCLEVHVDDVQFDSLPRVVRSPRQLDAKGTVQGVGVIVGVAGRGHETPLVRQRHVLADICYLYPCNSEAAA